MPNTPRYRTATIIDVKKIAKLHAQSWSKNYRGALSDHFLDQVVQTERLDFWQKRFRKPIEERHVILAESGGTLAGFVCLELDADPRFGTLLDNLHVKQAHQGKGIGRMLMHLGAQWVMAQRPQTSIHLFVLTQNEQATRVYERAGGLRSDESLYWETEEKKIPILRFTWRNAADLAAATA